MELSAKYKFATLSLESNNGSNRNADTFGANGLPLTPPSITMVGNFHSFVRSFNAQQPLTPYLTHYLDCIRSKNEKITLVFEHYLTSVLSNESSKFGSEQLINCLLKCGLYALYHLHYVIGAVHGLISPNAFLFTGNTNQDKDVPFKLTHWAINIITEMGRLCQSQIYPDDIRFISPEQCLLMLKPTKKSDIWSFALTILYVMCDENHRKKFPSNPIDLFENENEDYPRILLEKLNINIETMSDKWKKFFNSTLQLNPGKRASIKDLFKVMNLNEPEYKEYDKFIRTNACYRDVNQLADEEFFKIDNYMDIHEFYYLWSIAYPSKDTADKEEKKNPAILMVPRLAILENETSNQSEMNNLNNNSNDNELIEDNDDDDDDDDDIVQKFLKLDLNDFKLLKLPSTDNFNLLPVETITKRLIKMSSKIFAPLLLHNVLEDHKEAKRKNTYQSLPIPIRETDFDYQCERLLLLKALMNGYPFLKKQLILESRIDICPHYRAQIWSSLLNVQWNDKLLFERIDKLSKTTTDRQIAVDIPRCHQYNALLASPEGHRKLTRILKAWLAYNESNEEVYWQGLDSLAAPFVILNFNNESQAFACFDHFVKKYLHGFFKKDNSKTIQEYLALFQIIITFHDPVLSNHLAALKFIPDLYAISWFLTMFTHILPLYQIFQLWDTLILGNESFPLFIGLAILHQLRDRILDFTFNDCILIFSDLPQIDIDRCVRTSVKFFCSTPKSISKRNTWEIDVLKKMPRLPRIKIEDLTFMMDIRNANNNTNINMMNSGNVILSSNNTTGQCCTECGQTTTSGSQSLIILDCRTKEDVSKYGSFIDSIKYEDYINQLQQKESSSLASSSSSGSASFSKNTNQNISNNNSNATNSNNNNNTNNGNNNRSHHQPKHDLIVVVNSVDKCIELIEHFSIAHVCLLEWYEAVPKQLLLLSQ